MNKVAKMYWLVSMIERDSFNSNLMREPSNEVDWSSNREVSDDFIGKDLSCLLCCSFFSFLDDTSRCLCALCWHFAQRLVKMFSLVEVIVLFVDRRKEMLFELFVSTPSRPVRKWGEERWRTRRLYRHLSKRSVYHPLTMIHPITRSLHTVLTLFVRRSLSLLFFLLRFQVKSCCSLKQEWDIWFFTVHLSFWLSMPSQVREARPKDTARHMSFQF